MRKRYVFWGMVVILVVSSLFCSSEEELPDISALQAATPLETATSEEASLQYANDDISQSRQNAITTAISRVSPAIVGINVVSIRRYVRRSPFQDDPFWDWFYPRREYQQRVKGLGSGFLISPEGYILTNEHVVHDATEIIVTTTDGKQYEAKSVGEDATYDVALLKIEPEDDESGFPYIRLGNSDDILIGEWVIALGNPFGLFDVSSEPTVTVGVVSASNMDFIGNMAVQGRSYKDMIQTDASINQGNSGGPLVNSLGQCIGINTVIMTGGQYSEGSIGIGFAIPINRVKKILPDLKNIGKVDRSFQTGLEVENINRVVAMMLGISPNDGVIITRVTKKSPAEESGLKVGDVIVAIDETRVRSTSEVQQIIDTLDVTEQQSVQLTIYRKGKLYEVDLELERS